MASCDDDDKVVDEGLKVLSAETSFGANGGEHEISVNKDVVKAYAADDWLAVNAQGSKVTISTQANVSNESRHTTLVVKSSEYCQCFSVGFNLRFRRFAFWNSCVRCCCFLYLFYEAQFAC